MSALNIFLTRKGAIVFVAYTVLCVNQGQNFIFRSSSTVSLPWPTAALVAARPAAVVCHDSKSFDVVIIAGKKFV
jgi:hypothetical protein